MFAVRFALVLILAKAGHGQVFDFLRPKTIRLDKFVGTCPEYKDAPITFHNINIRLVNRMNLITFKMIIKNTINDTLKMKLYLNRCKSRETLDSCEVYQSVTVNRLCDLINGDNRPWTPLVKMCQPPISCPLKKGVYNVQNGTLDGGPLSHLPIAGWYWIAKTVLTGEKTKKVVLCTSVEGQIVPV